MIDEVEVAVRVASAFERAGIEYVLGGSVASSLQGEPRDRAYLQEWARHLDVADLLSKALMAGP